MHGLNVDARDKQGHTALHAAAAEGKIESARLLLANKANINAQDRFGMTPLMYAVQANNAPTVLFLLKQGADKTLRDLEQKWTAEQRARYYDCEQALSVLQTGVYSPPPQEMKSVASLPVDANRRVIVESGKPNSEHSGVT